MMRKVIEVETKENYQLDIVFDDGLEGTITIKSRLFGTMFQPLKDLSYFKKATIDEYGTICWPNGADLSTDTLYKAIKKRSDSL